jgi:hypothetical protein
MSEWSSMQVSGFLGWIHRLVMFITWPLRNWKYLLSAIVIIVLFMIAYAFYHGVRFSEMFDWYKVKLSGPVASITGNMQNVATEAQKHVDESIDTVKEKVQKMAPEIAAARRAKENNEPIRFVAWNVAKFNKAKYQPQEDTPKVKLKAPTFTQITEDEPKIESVEQPEIPIIAPQLVEAVPVQKVEKPKIPEKPYYDGKLSDYYTIRRDLDLTYLAESEKLYGHADVMGPNSLYLDNTYMYLYGIFTNPNDYDSQSAQLFLEKRLQNKSVHCDIVAYTSQTQAATALCFVDGKLINREMVEAGLAEDVALK